MTKEIKSTDARTTAFYPVEPLPAVVTGICCHFLGVSSSDKLSEDPLHGPDVLLKEPWENGKSPGSAGSPEEEAGMWFSLQAFLPCLSFCSFRSLHVRLDICRW